MRVTSSVVPVVLLAVFLGGVTGIAFADKAPDPSPEEALLALINQARENPLETAAALGMDPEKIVEDFPELEEMFEAGLSPLTINEQLVQTADEHTEDMFERGYYSSVTPDDIEYSQRSPG